MSGGRGKRLSFAAAALALSGTASAAVIVPKRSDVCVGGKVDHQQLVTFLLDSQGVSRRLEDWAEANPSSQFASLTLRERLIVDENICKENAACLPDDRKRLAIARHTVLTMLRSMPGSFGNPTGFRSASDFFVQDGELLCRTDGGEAVEAPGAIREKYTYSLPLRIRGTSDALMFTRDESGFKAAEKASLSFTDDGIADKKSHKIVAVAGYPVTIMDRSLQFAELIPYVGWNRNVTKLKGQEKSVSADTWRFGAMVDYALTVPETTPGPGSSAVTHWFSARPEYALNRKDGSEVASLNFIYMPVINQRLNDYIRIVPDRAKFLSIRPIIDLRFNNGIFVDAGSRAAGTSRDYSRVGAQIGFALTSDHPNFPADLTVTDTFMYALTGHPDTLNQFKAVLSFAFDPKRHFGVELSYTHGRREDVADRESLWSFGLAFKY